MQLILLQKVTNLGNLGDKVDVKPGYGRNFLVPQGKAVPATATNLAEFEAKRADYEAKAAANLGAASARQAKLAEVNAGIAERRAAAMAQAEAARAAARDQIHAAVSDVAGRAGELATGRKPSTAVVERVVNEVMAR